MFPAQILIFAAEISQISIGFPAQISLILISVCSSLEQDRSWLLLIDSSPQSKEKADMAQNQKVTILLFRSVRSINSFFPLFLHFSVYFVLREIT